MSCSVFLWTAVVEWATVKKQRYLGVPQFLGYGQHKKGDKQYRFLVMQRLSTDLQKIFEQNGRSFSEKTTFGVGLRMVWQVEFTSYSVKYCFVSYQHFCVSVKKKCGSGGMGKRLRLWISCKNGFLPFFSIGQSFCCECGQNRTLSKQTRLRSLVYINNLLLVKSSSSYAHSVHNLACVIGLWDTTLSGWICIC